MYDKKMRVKNDSVFFTLDMLDKFLQLQLPPKDHPHTCPMGEAAPPTETVRLPPLLVRVAERDLIRDTNTEYCEAMRKAGKDVELLVSARVSHSFYLDKFALDDDPVTGKSTEGEELIAACNQDFVCRH